ncbi:fructosamine 3 kinase L homeolog isoform X1 [Xenopus laevis]|uniref:protein-ribulosamine 3-kinase n=1 Tax=Xenopus laevis TaxID=8355 RepID=A0A8J1LR31_XENLA|nr:fructosamine 3 kinase L homeolog isoform X1 [Xenopus laevis]
MGGDTSTGGTQTDPSLTACRTVALAHRDSVLLPQRMLLLKADVVGLLELEEQLRKVLKTSILSLAGHNQGGFISQALSYDTDQGRVFVKINCGAQATIMFTGEVASLKGIKETATVRVPEPIAMADLPSGGGLLILEYLQMRSIGRFAEKLGEQLADLHLHNILLKRKSQRQKGTIGERNQAVDKFGFHTMTCCGYIPQVNDWQDDWVNFFARQRLKPQLDLIEKNYGDRAVQSLWTELQIKLHKAFKDTLIIPSLLHGDLWEANVAEDESGPLLFDPGSFYGHSEYDLSIGEMFGAQGMAFFSSYHRKIPKAPGFETRSLLYQLFHSLNNWNHFGSDFQASSLSLMRAILDSL